MFQPCRFEDSVAFIRNGQLRNLTSHHDRENIVLLIPFQIWECDSLSHMIYASDEKFHIKSIGPSYGEPNHAQ